MICKFKTKWNGICDAIYSFGMMQINSRLAQKVIHSTLVKRTNLLFQNKCPNVYNFISLCNHMNSPTVNIFGRKIKMDYPRRSTVVSVITIIKEIRGKDSIKPFFFWSMILCRENLNPLYYKFNLDSCKKKPLNPADKIDKKI